MTRTGTAAALVLLLASAVSPPLSAQGTSRLLLRAENPLPFARPDETIVLVWSTLQQRLPALRPNAVRVVDSSSGQEVPVQALDANQDGAVDSLLFLASFWPGESKNFAIEAAPHGQVSARVHAKYVGDRDDIAWESERIAYRVYGQGLWKQENTHSSGIDVWPKRVRELVLDKWYAKGHDEYHTDRGEGADFFKVGPTLGAGGSAIWKDGKLYRAENFKAQRVLVDGPLRAIFELDYERWDAAGTAFTQTKRITIQAGQNIFKEESVWRTEGGAADFTYAVGTVKRPGLVGSLSRTHPWIWLSTWGPIDPATTGHSDLGTAVLIEKPRLIDFKETDDHYVLLAPARSGVPVVQYVGAGWSAAREFTRAEDWWRHLNEFAQRLANPIKTNISADVKATSENQTQALSNRPAAGVVAEKQLEDARVAQPEELLTGRFAGVRVLRLPNGGVAVRIRGGTSVVGSNEPLYVVDGLPIEPGPGGALTGINPSDITKIEVLKDIGSTSLYGVRGANGVVLISTRRGR